MRVTRAGAAKSGEQKAIDVVVKENGHQILPQNDTNQHNNIKKKIPSILNSHRYRHAIKDYEVSKNIFELLEMADDFIEWIKKQKSPQFFQTFWSVHGITTESICNICNLEPDFKQKIDFARQLIGEKWGDGVRNDIQTLRNRAAIYIKEFKDHDVFMIEVRERFKKQLEKEDALTPQQQQALFYSFMEPFLNKKSDAGK